MNAMPDKHDHKHSPRMKRKFTILLVDDDQIIRKSMERILTRETYGVAQAPDADTALHLLESEDINLVILDIEMPKRNGISLLRDIVRLYPDIPVIMLSGHGNISTAVEAIKLGASDFLEKPCAPKIIVQRLDLYRDLWQQHAESPNEEAPTFDFPGLIGTAPTMERVKSLIVRIAPSDAPVLVLGESGTGKELAAKAIHHHSRRHEGPFVAVDCAALTESVLESELFGHERGAFTGAVANSIGLIRAADGGTLFLDEIGELPFVMQAKLLRTLQEFEVRPVGGQHNHPVDIRIVAATNRDLEEETRKGSFRSDLYFRISAIPLIMPSLRDRPEDIIPLAEHFLHKHAPGGSIRFQPQAIRLLQQHRWPGNVRELENVVQRALALCDAEWITPDDLPATIVMDTVGGDDPPHPHGHSLKDYERLAVENALRRSGGNRRQAAALLGIGEATLYRKLKEFDLSK